MARLIRHDFEVSEQLSPHGASGEIARDQERSGPAPQRLLGLLPLAFIALTNGTFVGLTYPWARRTCREFAAMQDTPRAGLVAAV